jgi:hypothetical protein
MKTRPWKITRQLVTHPDAQRRWDQAYQSLLRWTSVPVQSAMIEPDQTNQEEAHADCCVRSGLHPTASPNTDH